MTFRVTLWCGEVVTVAIDPRGFITHDGEPVPCRNTWRRGSPDTLLGYCKRIGWIHPKPVPIPKAPSRGHMSDTEVLVVVEALCAELGSINKRDLADRLQCAPTTAFQMLQRLERSGAVARGSDGTPGARTLWHVRTCVA